MPLLPAARSRAAERLARGVVVRVEAGGEARASVAAQIVEAGIDPAAQHAHVLGVRRIGGRGVEAAEVEHGLGDRGRELARGVVDAVAAVARSASRAG